MNSKEIVTKTIETIEIGDKSINVYVYNGNEEKPLLFLIREINDAVYGSPKNNVNMFYKAKTNGNNPEFVWKFNKLWQLYQPNEVDQQSTSKTVKEDHIFFTEDGLYECLGYATLPHAREFQKQLRLMLKEIRQNKLKLTINDKSSVFGQLSKQEQLHGVMKHITKQQSDLQPVLSHKDFQQSIDQLVHNDKILKISERNQQLEQLEEESKSDSDKYAYSQMRIKLLEYKQQIQKELDDLTNNNLQQQLKQKDEEVLEKDKKLEELSNQVQENAQQYQAILGEFKELKDDHDDLKKKLELETTVLGELYEVDCAVRPYLDRLEDQFKPLWEMILKLKILAYGGQASFKNNEIPDCKKGEEKEPHKKRFANGHLKKLDKAYRGVELTSFNYQSWSVFLKMFNAMIKMGQKPLEINEFIKIEQKFHKDVIKKSDLNIEEQKLISEEKYIINTVKSQEDGVFAEKKKTYQQSKKLFELLIEMKKKMNTLIYLKTEKDSSSITNTISFDAKAQLLEESKIESIRQKMNKNKDINKYLKSQFENEQKKYIQKYIEYSNMVKELHEYLHLEIQKDQTRNLQKGFQAAFQTIEKMQDISEIDKESINKYCITNKTLLNKKCIKCEIKLDQLSEMKGIMHRCVGEFLEENQQDIIYPDMQEFPSINQSNNLINMIKKFINQQINKMGLSNEEIQRITIKFEDSESVQKKSVKIQLTILNIQKLDTDIAQKINTFINGLNFSDDIESAINNHKPYYIQSMNLNDQYGQLNTFEKTQLLNHFSDMTAPELITNQYGNNISNIYSKSVQDIIDKLKCEKCGFTKHNTPQEYTECKGNQCKDCDVYYLISQNHDDNQFCKDLRQNKKQITHKVNKAIQYLIQDAKNQQLAINKINSSISLKGQNEFIELLTKNNNQEKTVSVSSIIGLIEQYMQIEFVESGIHSSLIEFLQRNYKKTYTLQQINGDGKCLYRSMSYVLNQEQTEETMNNLRSKIAAVIQSKLNCSQDQDAIEELKENLLSIGDHTQWGNLKFIEQLNEVQSQSQIFYLYPQRTLKGIELQTNYSKSKQLPNCFIVYNGINHFDVLKMVQEPIQQEAEQNSKLNTKSNQSQKSDEKVDYNKAGSDGKCILCKTGSKTGVWADHLGTITHKNNVKKQTKTQ